MARAPIGFLVCAYAVLFASTCKHRTFSEESKEYSNPSDVEGGYHAHIASSGEQFLLGRAQSSQGKIETPKNVLIAEPSGLLKRMQSWADTIDVAYKKKNAAMKRVPAPRIALIQEEAWDAESTTATVCFDVDISIGKDRSDVDASNGDAALRIEMADGHIERSSMRMGAHLDPNRGGKIPCVFRPEMESSKQAIISGALRNLGTCQFSWHGQGLRLEEACFGDDIPSLASASQIQVPFQQNWIVFSTGFVAGMTEEHYVAVLAHELGHYYKAHAVGSAKDFGYLYKLDDPAKAGLPKRDASLEAVKERFKRAQAAWIADRANENASKVLRSVLQEMHGQRLNSYTSEQQADEVALDLLDLIGVGAAALDGVVFLLWEKGSTTPNEAESIYEPLESSECRKLYGKGFVSDGDGSTLWVPEGDFSTEYHQPCFRIFNAVRYASANRYSRSNHPQILDAAAMREWESLRVMKTIF